MKLYFVEVYDFTVYFLKHYQETYYCILRDFFILFFLCHHVLHFLHLHLLLEYVYVYFFLCNAFSTLVITWNITADAMNKKEEVIFLFLLKDSSLFNFVGAWCFISLEEPRPELYLLLDISLKTRRVFKNKQTGIQCF